MSFLGWVGTILGVILGMGTLAASVYAAIRSQSSKMKDDVIKAQESLLDTERQKVHNLELRMATLEARVATLTHEFAVVVAGAVVAALHESWPGVTPPTRRIPHGD